MKALVPPFLLRHCHPRVATPREGIFTITYPLKVFFSAHLVVTAARIQIELVLIELEPPFCLEEADSLDAPITVIFVPYSHFDCDIGAMVSYMFTYHYSRTIRMP